MLIFFPVKRDAVAFAVNTETQLLPILATTIKVIYGEKS